MSGLFVRDGVHFATVGDDLVSLDWQRGDYGCFPSWGGAIRIDDDGRITPLLEEAALALVEAGLATTSAPQRRYATPLPLPTASAWRAAAPTPAITHADRARMAAVCAVGLPAYWTRSFAGLLRYAAGRRDAVPSAPDPNLARDAQVFDHLLPFVPFQGVCLFRSFMLLRYLRAAGRDARWVIGVKTYPFEAHCWLQVGDVALDDAAERVCGFTPILAT